jgi:hypothetical protein
MQSRTDCKPSRWRTWQLKEKIMLYIQRKGNGYLETVDEFATRKEAKAMLKEYQLADPSAEYYISSRACKAWAEK